MKPWDTGIPHFIHHEGCFKLLLFISKRTYMYINGHQEDMKVTEDHEDRVETYTAAPCGQ